MNLPLIQTEDLFESANQRGHMKIQDASIPAMVVPLSQMLKQSSLALQSSGGLSSMRRSTVGSSINAVIHEAEEPDDEESSMVSESI